MGPIVMFQDILDIFVSVLGSSCLEITDWQPDCNWLAELLTGVWLVVICLFITLLDDRMPGHLLGNFGSHSVSL